MVFQAFFIQCKIHVIILSFALIMACAGADSYVPIDQNKLDHIKELIIFVELREELTLVQKAQDFGVEEVAYSPAPFFASVIKNSYESVDAKKAKQIWSSHQMSCQQRFLESLQKSSKLYNRFNQIWFTENQADIEGHRDADAVLTLDVVEWGIKAVPKSKGRTRFFMDIRISLKDTSNNKLLWNDRQLVSLLKNNSINSYLDNIDLLENHILEVIKKSSKRIEQLLVQN